MPRGLQVDAWNRESVTYVILNDFQERRRERIVFALEELRLSMEQLERDVVPGRSSCLTIGVRPDWVAKDEGGGMIELEFCGVFEVGFSGMKHHQEQIGFQELKERVAFEDDVDRGRGVSRFYGSFGGMGSGWGSGRDFV